MLGAVGWGAGACLPQPDLLVRSDLAGSGLIQPVFAASTRLFQDGAFLDTRAEALDYLRIDVAIPPEREPGALRPARRLDSDPEVDFFASRADRLGGVGSFFAALEQEAARTGSREVSIFVHGFNNTFGNGLYRTAQIMHDFGLPGVGLHYAWASAAHPLGYAHDRDSALHARDGLAELLRQLTERRFTPVLLAHSLGSLVVMETLRELRIAGDDHVLDGLDGVVLFSPDIDVDVFRAQARRIHPLPQPFVVFTSQRDGALQISARITGQDDRVGTLSTADQVAEFEITLVDVSAFEGGVGDPFNHFAGVTSPAVVAILREVAQVGQSLETDPTQQAGLLPGTILTIQNATQVLLTPLGGN